MPLCRLLKRGKTWFAFDYRIEGQEKEAGGRYRVWRWKQFTFPSSHPFSFLSHPIEGIQTTTTIQGQHHGGIKAYKQTPALQKGVKEHITRVITRQKETTAKRKQDELYLLTSYFDPSWLSLARGALVVWVRLINSIRRS